MISLSRIVFLLLILAMGLQAQSPSAADFSKEEKAVEKRILHGIEMMEASRWQKALQHWLALDKGFAGAGVERFGPKYASVYYHTGLCQMQLATRANKAEFRVKAEQLFQAAADSFARCVAVASTAESSNIYQMRSLLSLGVAQQGLGQYQAALRSYHRFLLQRNQMQDRYDRASMLANLAICYSSLEKPNISKASEYLEELLEGYSALSAEYTSVTSAVHAYLLACKGADAQSRILALIERHRQVLTPVKGELKRGVPQVLLLASSAMQQEMWEVGLVLIKLLPGIEPALQRVITEAGYLEQRIDILSSKGAPMAVYAQLAKEGGDPVEKSYELAGYAYEKSGQASSAQAFYRYLVGFYPSAKFHQDHRYHLARLELQVGSAKQAQKYCLDYLDEFPHGKYAETVKMLMLTSLFDSADYAEAEKWATSLLQQQGLDRTLQSVALYVAAGSRCYLGEYWGALQAARTYQQRFPSSERLAEVQYFEALALSGLHDWQAAERLLNQLSAQSELSGEYTKLIVLERAKVAFGRAHYAEVVSLLGKLLGEPLEPANQISAQLLMGQAKAIMKEREQALKFFLMARELAKSQSRLQMEDEVLFYLVELLGREKVAGRDNAEQHLALPYYDAFFESYPDSEFAPQVAAAGFSAMFQAGRGKEALARLVKVLKHALAEGREAGLEAAANTYIWGALDCGKKLADLRADIEAIPQSEAAYAVLMRHALIAIYREGYQQASYRKNGLRLRYQASMQRLRSSIINNYHQDDIVAYVLVDLADWVAESGKGQELARSFNEKALTSSVARSRYRAMLGLARLLSFSEVQQDRQRAEQLLSQVIARNPSNEEFVESALYYRIELCALMENWQTLSDQARTYLVAKKLTKRAPRVSLLLANSYENRGMLEDAIASYNRIFVSYTRDLPISAPAVARLTELTWQRNRRESGSEVSDRQLAYQLGHRYLTLIEDVAAWKKQRDEVSPWLKIIADNVAQWEKSGEVRSVESLLDDLRKQRLQR